MLAKWPHFFFFFFFLQVTCGRRKEFFWMFCSLVLISRIAEWGGVSEAA